VVASSDGVVSALNAADGTPMWQTRVSGEVLATPAVSGSVVVVRSVDGRLRALSGTDGRELWSFEHKPPRLSLRGNASPAVGGELVVAGFDNGRIGAYTLREGEPVWENLVSTGRGRTELERLADVDADVQVVGQDVYAASFNGRLANLAIESGQIIWAIDLSSHDALGVDWTTVYATDAAGEVLAVNRASGAVIWRQNGLRRRGTTGPEPFGRSAVVGDFEGYLHWLDALTGAFQARVRADDAAIVGTPVGAGEYLLAQDEADRVFAFRIASAKAE
jgi:outer membrane protein assembly factor BamB